MVGFLGGIKDLFTNASLGDISEFVGAGVAIAGALKKPDAPQAPSFAPSTMPGKPENITRDIAEEKADQRKRSRQNTRASRRVSFLSDTDIGAVKLHA